MGSCLSSGQVFPGSPSVLNEKRTSNISQWTAKSQSLNTVQLQTKRSNIEMPLTEKEVFAITKSWKAISKTLITTGIAMFLRMFETRADVKSMFEQFRSVEKHDLGSSRSLESHALLVMNALDESIGNMDDPEYLIDMLLITGKSHRRFEDFSPDIFWAIEEPFIESIKNTLNERLTVNMEKIYRKTITFVLTTLIMGFKDDFPSAEETMSRGISSN